MRQAFSIALLLFLAGCSDAPEPADPSPVSSSSTSMAPVAAPEPVVEAVSINFDGMLGTSLHGCVFPAAACQTVDVTDDGSDVYVDRPGVNFTGLDLEVSWTAQTPATAMLTVGFMVMASCEGCNSTTYPEVTGTSPLRVSLQGVSVPLTPDERLHISVYNPQGLVYNPAVPGYAFVSSDQAFHIEGNVTLLVPPGAA
ncbi:MAG: hypothetical protein WC876_07715 [Candidatus Thermoplasmatota archaeon]|jgi:hypothetical protein